MLQPSKDRSQSQVVELLSHFLKYNFLYVLPNSSLFWESILESREKKIDIVTPARPFKNMILSAQSPLRHLLLLKNQQEKKGQL